MKIEKVHTQTIIDKHEHQEREIVSLEFKLSEDYNSVPMLTIYNKTEHTNYFLSIESAELLAKDLVACISFSKREDWGDEGIRQSILDCQAAIDKV
jgi:hypothetical protein